MAVDSDHHRAFLLCGGSRNVTVFNLETHKALAHFPVPQGAGVIKFDPGLRRAYPACSSFRKLEDFPVQKLVHSLAVDPETHRVCAPEQQENGRPVAHDRLRSD
jgi:hypothetical protein